MKFKLPELNTKEGLQNEWLHQCELYKIEGDEMEACRQDVVELLRSEPKPIVDGYAELVELWAQGRTGKQ